MTLVNPLTQFQKCFLRRAHIARAGGKEPGSLLEMFSVFVIGGESTCADWPLWVWSQ